jgi:hypothetical protein
VEAVAAHRRRWQCAFHYQPEGWEKVYQFIALRDENKSKPPEAGEPEQYQLFDTPA